MCLHLTRLVVNSVINCSVQLQSEHLTYDPLVVDFDVFVYVSPQFRVDGTLAFSRAATKVELVFVYQQLSDSISYLPEVAARGRVSFQLDDAYTFSQS